MKTIVLKSVFAFVIAIGLTSCKIDTSGIAGSGNVTTKKRDIIDFTKVSAGSGLDVVIEQGEFAVTVEADDNLHSHIKTNVENGVLKISSDDNFENARSKKVTVRMPAIKGIESGGGANVKSAGTLLSDDIIIESGSGSQMEITVESDKIVAESTSGSQLTLKGKALTLDTSSSSGSQIEAGNLIANDVTAQASSGSSTEVHAAVSIDATASSGSSVEYRGNPKKIVKNESSGGSISAN